MVVYIYFTIKKQEWITINNQNDVVIVAYGRSAICRAKKGSLAQIHPVEYGAQVLKGVLKKLPQLPLNEVDDVIVGVAKPINETGNNVSRLLTLRAELPFSVCGQTINRFCSSGLQAIATATGTIASGFADVIAAGGVEDMTKTFPVPLADGDYNQWLLKHEEGAYMSMGITAENVADMYGITRERMEKIACESHQKAARAQGNGALSPSIIPVIVKAADDSTITITADEGIRPETSMESLAKLKPCFIEDGLVTAATSSQTSDAAAFVVLMSTSKAAELNIKPIAKLIGFATAGCDPKLMGLGPIYAVPKVMKQTGLTLNDMNVIELNEAFAAQTIACVEELGIDESKLNPYGGAMALGHPLGATGAILTCKALDYLTANNGKYGLVSMCVGGGMGAAGIFEKL